MNRTKNMNAPKAPRAGGAVTPRLLRALAAGAGAGILAGSAPGWLLESLTLASGLASVFPPAAPPLGLTARLLIAIAAAAVALVLVWTLWRSGRERAPMSRDHSSPAPSAVNRSAAKVAEPVAGGFLGGLKAVLGGRAQEGEDDEADARDALLARRRADRHPDAPPRPPLVASRDLPDIDAMPVRKRSLVAAEEHYALTAGADDNVPQAAVATPATFPDPAPVPDAVLADPAPAAFADQPFDLAAAPSALLPEPESAPVPAPVPGPAFAPAPDFAAGPEPFLPNGETPWQPATEAAPDALPRAFEPIDMATFAPIEAEPLPVAFTTDAADDSFTPARSLGQPMAAPAGYAQPASWQPDDAFDIVPDEVGTDAPVAWASPPEPEPEPEPMEAFAAEAAAPLASFDHGAPADPLPPLPADDLATLAARFEAGIARREAIENAQAAARSLEARIALADQDDAVRNALRSLRPMAAVPDLVPAPNRSEAPAPQVQAPAVAGIDQHVDVALEQALGTLRKLSELGRR